VKHSRARCDGFNNQRQRHQCAVHLVWLDLGHHCWPYRDWQRQRRPLGLEVPVVWPRISGSGRRARLSPCAITGSTRTLPKAASAIPPRTLSRNTIRQPRS